MDEQEFINSYLMKHPDIIARIPKLSIGYDKLKCDLASDYYSAIHKLLKQGGVEAPGLPSQNDNQFVNCADLMLDPRIYICIRDRGIGLYCNIPEGPKGDETKECWLEAVNNIPETKLKNFIVALAGKKAITRPPNWTWRYLIVKELKFHDFGDPDTLKCLLDKSSSSSVDFKTFQCEPQQVVNNVLAFIKDIKEELKKEGLPF